MTPEAKQFFREICALLRLAITGSFVSPPLFKSMELLGKDECLKRLENIK